MSGIEPYSCEMNNLNAQWEMSCSDLRAIARFFFVCVCIDCFVFTIFFDPLSAPQCIQFSELRYERRNIKPCCGKHHAFLYCRNNWTGEQRMMNYKRKKCEYIE